MQSKKEVIKLLKHGSLSRLDAEFSPGHRPTNFTFWMTAEEPYQVILTKQVSFSSSRSIVEERMSCHYDHVFFMVIVYGCFFIYIF